MGGMAVAMSCATMEDVLVSAKQVLYEDKSSTKLGATDVQAAIDKLKARTEVKTTVDWKDITSVPSGLSDGDDVGQFKAGKGVKITGTTIDVVFGSAQDTAAHGNHTHPVGFKDLTEFDAAAKKAMGPLGNSNEYRHTRYGDNDLKASKHFTGLETQITTTQSQLKAAEGQIAVLVKKLNTRASCPRGYTLQSKAGMTLCQRGSDQVVRVGDFWVDRYEMLLVDSVYWADGKCDLTASGGAKYGHVKPFTYPTGFPRTGNWTNASKRLFACSVGYHLPSRDLSWFQAAQACAAAGKHLCTNEEWQIAAAGTAKSGCNTTSKTVLKTGSSSCTSSWGAEDMVGNVSEFVASWIPAGKAWMTKDEEFRQPWPSAYSAGAMTRNINSQVEFEPFKWTKGMLSSPRRGGDMDDGGTASIFAMDMTKGPVYFSPSTSGRCCMR